MAEKEKVLEVNNLVIDFKTDNGILHAVRNVSFDLYRGETLCIVGESGSGKSVTSKAIMGILANNAIVAGGSIMYRGENLLEVSEEEFHKIRGHKIGMIFQDPLSSLNPIVRIGKQITEAMLINSDKMKLYYQDLISDDLIAYRNCVAKKNIEINNVKKVYDSKVADYKHKKKDLTPEQREAAKKEISEMKQHVDESTKAAKANFAVESKPLKEKLNQTKKEAKVKVKERKQELLREHKNNLANLEKNFATCTTDEEKQAVQEEIQKEKIRYIDSIKITKAEAKRRALEVMKEVGIPEPERRFKQFPFEFSGGMRQRIVIAIALTASPEILICDEPTTALDVTIQAQILELINKIKDERQLTCIFITHDLGVVANMADRVAVMYAGKIVEYGTDEEIFFDPRHPYTWALLSSIPDVDSKERLDAIPGTPPNMIYPPKGDAFALRSKYAMKIDFEQEPPFFKISDTHYAATWLEHELAPKVEKPKIVTERINNSLKEGE